MSRVSFRIIIVLTTPEEFEYILGCFDRSFLEKLKPSPDSLKKLKEGILKDAQDEEWLRTKELSLECGDEG